MTVLRPYPSYKDSGIKWLGEIPAHWRAVRVKNCIQRIEQGWSPECENRLAEPGEWGVLKVGCVNYGVFRAEEHKALPPDLDPRPDLEVRAGQLLMSRANTTDLVGHVAIVPDAMNRLMLCDKLYRLEARIETADPKFLGYALRSDGARLRIMSEATGASSSMQNIGQDTVKNCIVALPSVGEQRAIAAFLDRETARIDGLIGKKRRLIELLREKRQAVISHAVTKGLDPNAPMKSSGIEWLGEIPAHWELLRAKILFREVDERSTSGDEELLTVSHISGVTRRAEREVNMFMAETTKGYKKCRAGDLIINTMWAWMGALGFAQEDGIVSPSYNVYRVCQTQALSTTFFDLLVRTPQFVSEATSRSKGVWTSRLRLYPEAFFDIRMAVPPLPEQDAIVGHLDRVFGRYDETIKTVELSIAKLEEHGAALITAAVTGKIDVGAHLTDAVEAAD